MADDQPKIETLLAAVRSAEERAVEAASRLETAVEQEQYARSARNSAECEVSNATTAVLAARKALDERLGLAPAKGGPRC